MEVHELANQRYYLVATGGGDANNGDSAILKHVGEEGRIRRYRFKFTIKDRRLSLNWLDRDGNEQMIIEVPEW